MPDQSEFNPAGQQPSPQTISRAQGCLLGQLAGDSLGSLVEGMPSHEVRRRYPYGVRELADGGTWNTIAGQPTDDSEMALTLARMLVEKKEYDPDQARERYVEWMHSGPFDCGETVWMGLEGTPNPDSQANGALMRISPLGIFGANFSIEQVALWAQQDAGLTHVHPVCRQANALFATAIAKAVSDGIGAAEVYEHVESYAQAMRVEAPLLDAVVKASSASPQDYVTQCGWVLIAFQNALWQLLHAESMEEGIVDTVMRGGDTDTNGAIAGALLGAVYGREAVPEHWVMVISNCRPEAGKRNVIHPRPTCYWSGDALEIAEKLVNTKPHDTDWRVDPIPTGT